MPCYVSTILFNGESEVIHDREKLGEIQPMTDRDYVVGGCTALIDAINAEYQRSKNGYAFCRKINFR